MFEKQSINNSKRNVKSIFQRRLFSKGNFNSIHKNKSKKNNIKIFSIRNRILDKKINISLKQYSEYKSQNFLKEKREKEKQKMNQFQNNEIKELNRNFNYTNMLKLLDIALNKNNPFKDYDLNSKINEIENMNKNINKNKLNNNLTKQILHDIKIKSKVDSGIKKDYNFSKIYRKINNMKLNLEKKNFFKANKNSDLKNYSDYCLVRNKQSGIMKNNSDFSNLKNDRQDSNKSLNLGQTINNNNSSIILNSKNNLNNKPRRANSVINNLSLNKINDIDKNSSTIKLRHMRNKSFHFKRANFNDKIFSKNTSASESINNISIIRPISKYKKKKNVKANYVKSKRSNIKRNNGNNAKLNNKTVSNVKPKIKNDSALIEGIYWNFKKIKSNSIKLKNRYKEWGFSSSKKIDNIVNAKEDMLIFLLKQKYIKYFKNQLKDNITKKVNKTVITKLKENFNIEDEDDIKRKKYFY